MNQHLYHRLWRSAVTMVSKPPKLPSVKIVEGLRECPSCGLFQSIPVLKPGKVAYCQRCNEMLRRKRRTSFLSAPMAFWLTSVAIYLALLCTDLLTINVHGRINTVTMLTGVVELNREGFGEIAFIVALATIFMPGIVLALMGAILYGISEHETPDWPPKLLTWYERLREWSMVEVYLLGLFVAYTKLTDLAIVDLRAGVYLIAALMLSMAAVDSTFDVERVWRNRDVASEMEDRDGRRLAVEHLRAGRDPLPLTSHMLSCHSCGLVMAFDKIVPREDDMGDCPRCHQTLHRRKPNSLANATALLVTGFICYIPANLLPVMTYTKVGQTDTSTIIHGAIELWQSNLIPLSMLVIFASIVVPVLKIVSLSVMVIGSKIRMRKGLKNVSRLYRVIDVIGRWSMIDVFMISILVAIVRFNFLANVEAEAGVVFFAIVVVVTIFAVHCFDIRSIWDAAGANGPELNPLKRGRKRLRDASEPSPKTPRTQDMEPEHA